MVQLFRKITCQGEKVSEYVESAKCRAAGIVCSWVHCMDTPPERCYTYTDTGAAGVTPQVPLTCIQCILLQDSVPGIGSLDVFTT